MQYPFMYTFTVGHQLPSHNSDIAYKAYPNKHELTTDVRNMLGQVSTSLIPATILSSSSVERAGVSSSSK